MTISMQDLRTLGDLFEAAPQRSFSLPARAYVQPGYVTVEQEAIFYKSWQYGVPCGTAAPARGLCGDDGSRTADRRPA